MIDFIVGFICHPVIDHICVFFAGLQQLHGLRFIELDGLVSKGLSQIHFWRGEQRQYDELQTLPALHALRISIHLFESFKQ